MCGKFLNATESSKRRLNIRNSMFLDWKTKHNECAVLSRSVVSDSVTPWTVAC